MIIICIKTRQRSTYPQYISLLLAILHAVSAVHITGCIIAGDVAAVVRKVLDTVGTISEKCKFA